jgi:hypothetical protein
VIVLKNNYKIMDNYSEIYFTNTKDKTFTVIVDTEDLHRLLEYGRNLYVSEYYTKNAKTSYKRARIYGTKGVKIPVVEFILGCYSKNLEIDHINRNPLDNRKENLRLVDHHTNCMNRANNKKSKSGIKGVHWCNTHKLWKVTKSEKGKHLNFGYFKNLEDAIPVAKEIYKF